MALAQGDAALDGQLFKRSDDAKRGIPEAIFIEDVEALCKNRSAADVVARLQELLGKYQYMMSSMVSQRASLKVKLPDISNALETVNHLIERRDKAEEGETTDYTYQLAENIWAKASAPASKTVCLWLGANCMLEYTLEEGVELLTTNQKNAELMAKSLDEDMALLRDQLTTTEVNIARCHNYGVKQRTKEKEEEAKNPKPAAPQGSTAAAAIRGAVAAAAPPKEEDTGPWSWKQDKEEVEVSVKLPEGAKKDDVKVTILAGSIKVEHSGQVLIAGQLAAQCSPNGSTWTMSKNRVDLSLEKAEAEQWPSLFEESEV